MENIDVLDSGSPDIQETINNSLRSEQRAGKLLPQVLSRTDFLIILIVIVVFIPDGAVVQATQQAGGAAYLYWIIGAVTFLLPGAVVTAQLNRFMPVEGSIYAWTHRAFGSLWGFFAAFCAWFPGVLVLLTTGQFSVSLVQSIGNQVTQGKGMWLVDTWQQGLFVVLFLVCAGWISTLSLKSIMKLTKGIVVLYGLAIVIVGLAGAVWLLKGNAPQTPFTSAQFGTGAENVSLYGAIVLALLGIEVPLNMAAETKQRNAASLFLKWGPVLIIVAYLIDTFGVMAVVPQNSTNPAFSTLDAVGIVFGTPISVAVGTIFISFFFITAVIYNIAFARLLFVSALDHRLPSSLAKTNRNGVPSNSTNIQTLFVLIAALLLYFIVPLLYPKNGLDYSARISNVADAATTVIWCLSMIILFADLPILLRHFKRAVERKPALLIAPQWVLVLCCVVGSAASIIGIWATLSSSYDSQLIPDTYWGIIVGSAVLVSLFIGLIGAAYPRLLSNLNEQTMVARENARLYAELRMTHAKLSELDQLKDAFLATASHELRTPLTIVQGYLELLNDLPDDPAHSELRRTFLHKASLACDELVLLQANIMDSSTIEFDTVKLHFTTLSLKEACAFMVDMFEPLITKQGRHVEVDVGANLMVQADETRLKQILRNLIANAINYSPDRTPIRITASIDHAEQMARINVIDRGLGIPLDKQEDIFDRFVRLERDMVGNTRGSGLGLAICRQLVEAMHGTISVHSSGIKGEGSTFSFTLPLEE